MTSSLMGEPFRWTPHTCADALFTGDAGGQHVKEGTMISLANLVPDPTTIDLWVCRPASILQTNFSTLSGFGTLGFVSGLKVVGNYAFGWVASTTGSYSGKDVPFMFNLVSGSFITISGITTSNVPSSTTTSGTWTPPNLELIGAKMTFTHPGFDGVTNYVGWLDITTPASPVWTAGNTATNALPCVPSWVAQFNGRAYYICNPAGANPSLIASDALAPQTRTNAGYVLTFGDNVVLIAAAGLALQNQLGGVIQSLIVFKTNNLYQVTGDPATSNLAYNSLNVAIGTLSPLSICPTPEGLSFVATDGMRMIDFDARVSDPIGFGGDGITVPLQQAVTPSRVCAACNGITIRIMTQNGSVSGQPYQEWDYDIVRTVWHGPHSFSANQVQPYGSQFIIAAQAVPGSLFNSNIVPNSTSTYMENGAQLTFDYQTCLFPAIQDEMCNYSIVESQLWAGFDANSAQFSVTAYNENGVGLNTCVIKGATTSGGVWGTSVWGSFIWGGIGQALSPRRLNWTVPVVYTRLSVQCVGTSAANVKLGDVHARVRQLGYVPNQ